MLLQEGENLFHPCCRYREEVLSRPLSREILRMAGLDLGTVAEDEMPVPGLTIPLLVLLRHYSHQINDLLPRERSISEGEAANDAKDDPLLMIRQS